MEKVVKVCKKHGDLYENDVYKHKDPYCKLGYSVRCKGCKNERTWKDGVICKRHGKLSKEDIKSNGRCRKCHRISANRKRDQNRAWFNAKMAENRAKSPEKWKEYYKRHYQKQKSKYGQALVLNEILRMHGLKQEQYEKMILNQDNKCAICRKEETRAGRTPGTISRLSVDHCHETGTIRGLLCYRCNVAIGFFGDSVELLCRAIDYLLGHEKLVENDV